MFKKIAIGVIATSVIAVLILSDDRVRYLIRERIRRAKGKLAPGVDPRIKVNPSPADLAKLTPKAPLEINAVG